MIVMEWGGEKDETKLLKGMRGKGELSREDVEGWRGIVLQDFLKKQGRVKGSLKKIDMERVGNNLRED